MGTLMLVIGAGLFYNIIIFFICEEKSLKNANLSDMKCVVKEEMDVSECFEQYNTIKYMAYFLISAFIFGLLVANYIHIPNNLGLTGAMAYVFIPSAIGSLIILLVKWRHQPMIKLISSFMYGGGYMAASAMAMVIVYFLQQG